LRLCRRYLIVSNLNNIKMNHEPGRGSTRDGNFSIGSATIHCTTNRKVAGSIPDGVIGIIDWHNPSGRTMALGPTQPLTQMITRNIFWGEGVNAAGA
jgi:hypothetical protein